MKRRSPLLLALLLAASPALARIPGGIFPLIFGSDDRKDLYDVTDKTTLELARSTVALFDAKHVKVDGDDAVISGGTFDDRGGKKIDAGEKFYGQANGAFCSGALVGADMVLTAGHCFSEHKCADVKVVFDFALKKKDDDPAKRKKADVYSCAKLLAFEVGWEKKKDKDTPAEKEGGAESGLSKRSSDWAVIKLDRAVEGGRSPLPLNRQETAKGTAVMYIGHPYGLPTKVAAGATITGDVAVGLAGAHLDGGAGASGSPVIDVKTGVIEGVLVMGPDGVDDFEQQPDDCKYKGDDIFTREMSCPGSKIVIKSKVVQPVDANPAKTTRISTIAKDLDAALKPDTGKVNP